MTDPNKQDEQRAVEPIDVPVDDTPTEATPDAEKASEQAPASPEEQAEAAAELNVREEYDLPQEWSDAEVAEWLDKADTSVSVKADDVYRYDPTRQSKAVGDWSTAELRAQLKGELQGIPDRMTNSVLREYRSRSEEIPAAWTVEQAKTFIREGSEPAKTASGVWVKDVTRPTRDAAAWTDEELNAWARGEILAEGKASDLKLSQELRQRFNVQGKEDSVEGIIQQYLHQQTPKSKSPVQPKAEQPVPEPKASTEQPQEQAPAQTESTNESKASGALSPMNQSFIEANLQRYVGTVAPNKPISEETGGQAQRALDKLFNYVVSLEGPALVAGLDELKSFINRHRDGVFSPSSAYRFVHLLKGDRKQQQRHINLIELFLIVTGPKRNQRKQVDMRHMLSDQPAGKVDALVDYFTNYA